MLSGRMKRNTKQYIGNPILRFYVLWILISPIASELFLNTKELQWKLSNENRSCEVAAKVPGGVYGSLMDAGALRQGDFYFRLNDLHYRNVSYQNWTYETHFQVPEGMWRRSRVTLEFDGLDTISSVKLNGEKIGSSDNMFVRYSFDVKNVLKKNSSSQDLEVSFESPVEWSKKAFEKQCQSYAVPPKCLDPSYNGECHVNHIRKMQSSFAWDWGPAFPNIGIWKPWRMVGWSTIKLENIMFSAEPRSSFPTSFDSKTSVAWKVNLKITLECGVLGQEIEGNLIVLLNGLTYLNKTMSITPHEYSINLEESFNISKGTVDLWWPNGYGAQPLYNLSVVWASHETKETSEKQIRVGFRTVELDQSFIDPGKEELGRFFRFRVNNVSIFLKGSNWIPAHVLPERMDIVYIKQLLTDAAKTHQNCLRVWGGGIYESDEFYEIADDLGILIWQDFMFACSMYPATETFLHSVKAEVKSQVQRLQHHPSILLWAGNNENEAALRGNWYGTSFNFDQYKKDYIELYVNTIRNLTIELDSSRPFVVSSPSNGLESEEEGYVALHPYDNKYGDVHFYSYFQNGWNWTIYPKTRLASEYGFQSWPSFRTLRSVTTASDWLMTSEMMTHRQHHPAGNVQVLLELFDHFRVSDILKESLESFLNYLYLSQVNQAMAVKSETEFYRRSKSDSNEKGEGFTSGALYWQLNDIWQGASWSSIEYGGRWKMLHYYAAKFFRPVLLSPWIDGNKVKVTIVNDLLVELQNLTVTVNVMSYLQMTPVNSLRKKIANIEAQESQLAIALDLEKDLHVRDACRVLFYNPQDYCFLTFDLRGAEDPPVDQSAFLLLDEPRSVMLKKAVVKVVKASRAQGHSIKLTLRTNAVALFVWLETDVEGVFSDNGFLMTTDTLILYFEAREHVNPQFLRRSIQITTLADSDKSFRGNDISIIYVMP